MAAMRGYNPAAERLCTGKEANDLMNDYFINIGKDLASKLPTCNTGYDHDDTCSTSLPVFEELTKDHLLKILKKNNKIIRSRRNQHKNTGGCIYQYS